MLRQALCSAALAAVVGAAVGSSAQEPPAPPPAQRGGSSPTLRVENTQLELGNIQAGSDALATFVFHNDGESPVKIIRAKPS